MRSVKAPVSLALALVFCVSVLALPETESALAATEPYTEPIVRVGMYVETPVLDTKLFCSQNRSQNGFEIGYSDGESFRKCFELADTALIIVPQVNVSFSDESAQADKNGNIGVYSAVLGKYSDYSAALSAAKADNGFVAAVNGGYEARAHASVSAEAAKAVSGGKTVSSPAEGGLMILDANGKILFTYEDTSRRLALRARNGGTVNFPMLHHSGNINRYDYRGFFEYSVSEGRLYMINVLGLEEYTKCVMANEIGTSYTKETRKAFSVLARTVPMRNKHGRRGLDFNVCNNESCCQVYHGIYRMSEENNEIVDSTRGLICTYEGNAISAAYHNSNGGASCSAAAAWGGSGEPYLVTVFHEEYGDGDRWEKVFSKQEFYDYLTSRSRFSSLEDDDITMKILATDPYGSDFITALSVSDGSGNMIEIENSENVRRACGFASANFTLEYTGKAKVLTSDGNAETKTVGGVMTADGYEKFEGFAESYKTASGGTVEPDTVRVDGAGRGHGVGFSNTGSEILSEKGCDYEYILTFFFSGTELEYAKWQ